MNFKFVFTRGLLAVGIVTAFQPKAPQIVRGSVSLKNQLATFVNVSPKTTRDVGTFDQWAANCGVQKNFELYSEDGEDWSAVATQDLPAGSPVVFVPNSMILSSNRVAQEYGTQLTAAENQLSEIGAQNRIPEFRLFVQILSEYEKGDQSAFWPWLNSLPRSFYNGASMTNACFGCLPPYAASLAMKEFKGFKHFRKALKFVRLSKSTVRNREVKKWAYNIAVTRSFDAGGDRRIVPMADMFNHGTETEIEISYDEAGNCMAYTTKDVPAGSPLRMSYGDPTNPSVFLSTYGFLDETSPASFCKLMNLEQAMNDLGVDVNRMLFYKDTGEISEEVWDVLLYDILSSDPNLQQGFLNACMSGDYETKKSYHQQYFQYTYGALKDHVDGFLSQLDELSARAYARDVNKHPRIPLILKHNEFVKYTFSNVKARLDSMA